MENFTGLNTSRQSTETLERINDVAAHMLAQYSDYKSSAANAGEIIEKIYSNMESVCEYLKQTFAARGLSTDGIYCKRDEEIQSVLMSIKWKKIGFTLILNDEPRAIFRQDNQKIICYRILATKEDCLKIIHDNPDNYKSKLLDAEVASLYIPANKNDFCELKLKYITKGNHLINQSEAAKEFLLNVIEFTCKGKTIHPERE